MVARVVNGDLEATAEITHHPVSGLPQVRLGSGIITTDDVRSLEDDR